MFAAKVNLESNFVDNFQWIFTIFCIICERFSFIKVANDFQNLTINWKKKKKGRKTNKKRNPSMFCYFSPSFCYWCLDFAAFIIGLWICCYLFIEFLRGSFLWYFIDRLKTSCNRYHSLTKINCNRRFYQSEFHRNGFRACRKNKQIQVNRIGCTGRWSTQYSLLNGRREPMERHSFIFIYQTNEKFLLSLKGSIFFGHSIRFKINSKSDDARRFQFMRLCVCVWLQLF